MENHERVERELLEQCDQVATLVECFAWLQRCDECIEELCRTKRPRLAVGHRQSDGEDRATRECKVAIGVSCTLVANTQVAMNNLLSDERSTPHSRIVF